jgi:hypothetical protein
MVTDQSCILCTLCNPVIVHHTFRRSYLHSGCLLGLHFDPEDGGSKILLIFGGFISSHGVVYYEGESVNRSQLEVKPLKWM